ncbi:M23 family metallopeptidase [Bacillus sp. T33-2]|uniref:M23 family metallopeptidase n=1 Tax=Bacillus sp. T33-2 TaxID=2054168 RepID=UPI000C76BE48|nr:M23 family metallopeptidase [Bacillus sp. T33-2]PLR99628.1 M23 family peptidase [Bacillus sp. T33-2]
MYKITSNFGARESFRSSGHSGIDFAMENGEPLRSIRNGIVERVVDYGNVNAGKCITVKWEDGKTAVYGHLSKFSVNEGDTVSVGDVLGYSGNSGFSTGSHLHFGLKENGHFIDPSPYLQDIQHMNDSNYFVQQTAEIKINFFDYFQQHMDLVGGFLSDLKMNLIHFFISTDYSPLIQLFKHIIQFIFINI